GSLKWNGAEQITKNPEVVAVNGTNNLFGFIDGRRGNYTFAEFGDGLTVRTQTVGLNINVPTRYQSQGNERQMTVANSCTVDENGMAIYGDKAQVYMSPAKFTADDELFSPFLINPYDAAARLPSTVFLAVAKNYDREERPLFDSNGNSNGNVVIKEYNVSWVTTDSNGKELNLIEQKEDGGYGIKNPVVTEQDFIVYGKIGDRGVEKEGNPGYIWVKMPVRNLASALKNVRFDGVALSDVEISVDPYGEYELPRNFEAELESGTRISVDNVSWYVSRGGEDEWYPIMKEAGYDSRFYDADGKYIFSYEGGAFELRYTLEGNGNVIKQEIKIPVNVPERRIVATVDGKSFIDVYDNGDFGYGYKNVNAYEADGNRLFERLSETLRRGRISVAFEKAKEPNGDYKVYSLPVSWLRATKGEVGYENSIDRLLDMFVGEQEGRSMTLYGTIGTGTVNEQTVAVDFSFVRLILKAIGFERIYLALEDGAIAIDELDGTIDFTAIEGAINIRINKAFGLKDGDGKFASPYQYINYLFGEITLYFENGTVLTAVPTIDFGAYAGLEDGFNRKVLVGAGEEITAETTFTAIRLAKLSEGSVAQEIALNIHTVKDERIDSSSEIVAELFNASSEELYGDNYALPNRITVKYRLSGNVTYQVDEWNVGSLTMPYLDNKEKATGIPVRLINTLRRNNDYLGKQPTSYYFYYRLPCEDADYNITVQIPRKDLGGVYYCATDETGLYEIKDGVLEITNPYLYYSADSKYGLDVTKIPTVLTADIREGAYYDTDVNEHYVSWQFIEGVFTPASFNTGIDRVLFATADLPAYYGADGEKQKQVVELYLTVKALTYYGISYGEMPVVAGASGEKNVIVIDPYNDVMGYKGTFVLPTIGLTVLFNGGTDSFVFGKEGEEVVYKLFDDNNNVVVDDITTVPYDEKGHSLQYDGVKDMRVLKLRAYLPGYADGIPLYLDIQSRIIETVLIGNGVYDADGEYTGEAELENVFFIDPYNTATFVLPSDIRVKFAENADFDIQRVSGWEIYDEGSANWISLNDSSDFYSRADASGEAEYGFYKVAKESYKGKNHRLRGYISLGRTSTGIAGRQDFEIDVIVLNRSLKEEYATRYRYDDPLGGLLSDIPGSLTEDMFVDYDRYYAELALPEGYKYSQWNNAVLPYVNWSIENAETVVDYRGGFDKDINGNLYFGNMNTKVLLKVLGEEISAKYEELVKSRMWDGYFTSSGAPQSYSAQTTARLKELKAEFDKEVLYATYIKTLRYYNAGTEEERQTANFMTSTLVNEISAEYGYNKVTEMNEIVGKMFERVKKAFDNGDEGKESDIYSRWNGIREAFVAEDSETDPELSEYRLLKVAKYEILNDKARPVFTVEEQNGYNARLRARIEAGLRMYVSATTWDALYDRVTNAERGVMDSLIKGSDELSKATALTNYRNYVSVKLGSIGERATANITAPALSVGNIIERYDESGNPVYKTEFIFNVYSSISFVEDVDVETAYNYYPLLKEYIDEGVRLAMEDVRSANKGVALENYVAQKTAGYVNSIVPVRILVDEGGREEKVIDFEYVYGNFNENATIYKEHWENLYTYKQEKAVEHIAKLNGSTDEEKWNNAYKAHQINKETDVCAQMDEIKARQAELGSGYNYTQMLSEYAEALKRNATAEMDGYYAQAVIDANVIMTDYIMEGNTKVASITSAYGGSTGTFEEIFGSVAEKAYDKLKESYAVTDDKQAEITSAFNNENGGNGASKARTVYYLMKNNTVSSELRERTENIFYTYLGGANAYGTFMNNLSSIGLTEEYVTRLVEVATLENGAFERSRFNGAFTDEEYEDYKNYVLVRNVRDYFKSIGSDYGNTVGGWLDYAVREKYSAGFGALCESNSAYIDLREELCYVKRRAFVRYVRAYEAKGTVISDTIEEKKTSYYEKNEFMNSEYIVNRLLSSETFGYKSYLTPSAENVAALRSEALTMYRDAYADAKVKSAIDYAVYLYGDEAYAKLILRSDLGAEFINGLNNAYYRVLMDRMLDGINDKLISEGVSESEKQTTAYKTVEDGVRKTFTAVALANGKTFGLVQSAKISDIAEKTYLNNKYRNEIREYTDALLSLRTTYKNVAEIKTYDDVYPTDGETFDKINEAICVSSESLYTKSYDYINELLLKNEAYAYYYSVEKVVEEESGVEVYKQLGAYGLSSNSSAAETFVVAVKAAYIAATENLSSEGKALLANIIDDSVFDFGTEDSYFARAEALLNVYDILEANSDTEIAEAREILLNAILSNAVLPENGETEKAISEGIKLSVGQAIYKTAGITLDKIKVRSYLSFLAVLNALSEGRKGFGTEYLTEENISGDYSVTETAYKRKYVNLLCEVLKNGAYGVSLNVAYETVTGAIAEKEAAIRRAIELNDSTYAEKLLAKLRLTAAHEELVAGEEELSANAYLTNKRAEVENLILKRFISLATGADDNARKENAINLMKTHVFTVTTSFRAEDRVENEADKRHVIAFDKTALEENSGVSVKAPVYVGNAYKISVGNPDTQYKIDSIDYRYIQVEIRYVDFTDTSDAENIASFKDKNYIVIDPLAPVLPETVHAYGEYTATGSTDKVIYDIGYVTVDYGETFLYNIYDGQDKEVLSYSIDFIDVRGNRYTLPVGAEYLDRTVNRIYLETDIYGGTKVTNVYDEFNGYIDMFDEGSGKNLFTVNPILESMLDVNEKKYILPDVVSVKFADGTVQRLTEVEWDLSSVTYSLVGQTGINLRMNGYMCASDDGTVRNVAFDYGKQTITISLRDENGATISSQTYNNVPDENIWNMVLNVTDQTAVKVAVEKSDGTSVVLGEKTASGNYIDVPMEKYSLNPFDIVFPDNYTVTFKDGTETPVITDGGWRLEPGANGSYKMKDIIMGVAGDHNVMTEFNYLGYTIRVRFVADDIELEGLGEGEYYDGGVLYLVKGGGSVFEQLEDNYSYFYYNFSDVATKPDYRRVPLSFIDANISGISTENENVTTGVKGVLGWDKKAYPGGMTMSPNILFTIAVIDPMLYAKLGGETNPYVINDYISAPYDGNFQKKNDANEPAISEYFIKKYANGEELKFRINNDTVKYSVLQNEVHFECEFDMTGAFTRLCADSNGGKTVSFAVTLPLKGYLYTEVSGVEFDKTPVKNAKGEDLWKWNPVDEDSAEYRDGIVWELGKELKASYLPQATTAIGKNISLLWDLDGVNVNCSTVDTARGYYIVRGYYYDAEGKWDYKELAIFIDKFDASEKITEELGGSVNIYSEYNGRYYKLPIDPESEGMKMLRPDGSYASLSADAITIEYKGFGEDDRKYSTTNYPLDSGDYAVRVRIDDGNVTVSGELVFKLTIRPVVINPNNVTFVGESGNTVIYTYDGKGKELYVSGGLPTVKVDNWFASLEEKERLVNEQIAEGYGEITAKSRAYNKLYNRVTPATRRYLDDMKMSLEEETGLTNENLNAALFDRLMPNLEISEVIADVKYMDGNSVMKNAPIDVGIYTVTFTVAAADNTGNYYFNKNTVLSRVIEIVRPSVSYGIIDAEMEYNGKFQNPRISGLHDENGNLPAGVTVTYRYVTGVGSAAQYFTDGIKNVGVYTCEVEIDGGNNYPSGSLTNQQVRISAKELLIEIDGAESAYLDSVADVSKKVRFNGLVGNDSAEVFGIADVYTEAKSYFVPGVYGIFLNGFYIRAGEEELYSTMDLTDSVERGGKTYYRLYLKPASEDGSLYRYVTDAGEYVYAEIIDMIGTKEVPGNYSVYVAERGDYTVYVDVEGEETVYTVSGDEELRTALESIRDGQKVRIYLAAKDMAKTVYSGVDINVNAGVSIIGCYDEDKNILTYVEYIRISKGSVNLRILAFEAKEEGDVSLTVRKGAGAINVYDCTFDGRDVIRTTAIETENGYGAKIMTDHSSFTGYRTGILAYGGNMEIVSCTFVGNMTGAQILSDGSDIQVRACDFIGNGTGISVENRSANVLNNSFSSNRVAINAPGGDEVNLRVQNDLTVRTTKRSSCNRVIQNSIELTSPSPFRYVKGDVRFLRYNKVRC
ncbi:MAG: right-handed parallel beta-helix repeat-containing protein, partial [Christensenellales bacterium]